MLTDIVRFIFTALLGSICFLSTHVITAYTADAKQFLNRPMVMHRYPWIGSLAGLLSITVFILIPINGWFIWGWTGVASLTLFWLLISNSISPIRHYVSTRPFHSLLLAAPLLFGLTVINFLLFRSK